MISVIMPVYNRKDTVVRAIDSVLSQSFEDMEVIIVDDCSEDDIQSIVDGYKNPGITYIRLPERSGACRARNTGIKHAKGDYLAFMDSDDFWYKEKLYEQTKCMDQFNGDICICKIKRFNYPSEYKKVIPELVEGVIEKKELQQKSITDTIMVLARKEVFSEILFDENLFMWQDYDWMVRASDKFTVVFCDKILAESYYIGKDSITQFDWAKILEINLILYRKYKIDNERYRYAIIKLLNGIIVSSVIMGIDCREHSKELWRITKQRKFMIKHWLNCLGILKMYYKVKVLLLRVVLKNLY